LLVNRRVFLCAATSAAAGFAFEKGQTFPSETVRYPDPATEFEVHRLTDPKFRSWLPAYYTRAMAHRGNFLLYSSDRTGAIAGYRMDLKSGQSRALDTVEGLMPASLTLAADEKSFWHVAGGAIHETNLSSLRSRRIYEISGEYEAGPGFTVTDDGLYAVLVERKGSSHRLRLVTMRSGAAATVVESAEPISDPLPRPRRAGILYRRGSELWVVNFDGAQNRRLHVASGGLGPALWEQDGRAALYLNYPEDRKQLNGIRECTPDVNDDRLVSTTTQFVHFGRNSDASVMVGASGSKASPYLLLLVRAVKRELTLCEHKASDPALVAPIFSPNSQRVFFQSDRHGKLAIYSMTVDRLVSETEVE
jgi:oligogalacturonide lyase